MIARSFRLSKATDFAKTYKFGKSFNSPELYIKALSSHVVTTRVAVVVPKKVSKHAVDRNRDRRRVYEICRTNWSSMEPGYTIIITGKKSLESLNDTQLTSLVTNGLKNLKVMK